MAFETTRSEILKQAIELKRLYDTTRIQKYKDEELRLRRIVVELETISLSSGVNKIIPGTGTSVSPSSGTGDVTVNVINGLPVGGTAGQILAKIDATNYNTEWIDNYTSQIKHQVKLGTTMSKGTPVYVSGSTGGSGTNMIVSKASNDAEVTSSKTMGLLQSGGVTNDFVFVVTEGLLAGVDTSTATAGDPVWLGVNGALIFGVANKPSAPSHMVFLGIVTRVHAVNGEIFVKVQNGFELEELHNVAISSVANNNLLVYESATSLWKNKTIAAIFGGTPLVSVPTLAQVTTAGAVTTNAITVGGLTVDTNTLVVDSVNNRVGIGTTSPTTLLDVVGNYAGGVDNLIPQLRFQNANTTSSVKLYALARVLVGTGYAGGFPELWLEAYRDENNFGTTTLRTVSNHPLDFWTNNTQRLRLTAGGNVLIGTTTDAGYKLDVNGTFRANNRVYIGEDTTFASSQYYYLLNASADGLVVFTNNSGSSNTQATGFLTGELYLDGANPFVNHRNINTIVTSRNTNTSNILRAFYASARTANSGAANKVTGFLGGVNIEGSGNVTDAIGLEVELFSQTNSKTITNLYGLKVQPLVNSAGTITNTYGIYIDSLTAGTQTNAAYGIYQAGTNRNYFGGNLLIGTTTDVGYKLDVNGTVRFQNNTLIKGADVSSSTKVFEVRNSSDASIIDARNANYIFLGAGQSGGSNSGIAIVMNDLNYTQIVGYNYGNGTSASYKPIILDADGAGRNQGIYVNFGVSTNLPPSTDTEFAVRGRTADTTSYITRYRDSGNTDKFAVRADGALFTNSLQGWSGTLTVLASPSGIKTITVTNGIITNVI